MRFPGYIIGIEKSRRENISKNEACLPILQWSKKDESIPLKNNPENKKLAGEVEKMLDDCKRTFVSHIAKYSFREHDFNNSKPKIKNQCDTLRISNLRDGNRQKDNICQDANNLNSVNYINEDIIYNAYTRDFDNKKAFVKGRLAIENLKAKVSNDWEVEKNFGSPYTHILFYAMGWNTDQQEAMRNYNSLLTQLIEAKPTDKVFKPLFIGITWPSEWSWGFFEALGKVLSYPVKSDDADEVGLLWGSKLLRETLIPLKKDKRIPLIVIGHSFGARLTTMSIFGSQFFQPRYYKTYAPHNKDDIDLVVGLQGAFSANRFIPKRGGEYTPYEEFKGYAKKFIFTWSKYDTANPITSYIGLGRHVGGSAGKKTAEKGNQTKDGEKSIIFEFFTIKTSANLDNNYDLIYPGIEEMSSWRASFSDSTKVSFVDASAIIKNNPYRKGGNAHSDIYTPSVAAFIWDALENIPKK